MLSSDDLPQPLPVRPALDSDDFTLSMLEEFGGAHGLGFSPQRLKREQKREKEEKERESQMQRRAEIQALLKDTQEDGQEEDDEEDDEDDLVFRIREIAAPDTPHRHLSQPRSSRRRWRGYGR